MPSQALYRARLESGMCGSCGTRRHRRGLLSCAHCAKAKADANAERRRLLDRTDTCAKCGAARRAEGRVYCSTCLDYFARRAAAAAAST